MQLDQLLAFNELTPLHHFENESVALVATNKRGEEQCGFVFQIELDGVVEDNGIVLFGDILDVCERHLDLGLVPNQDKLVIELTVEVKGMCAHVQLALHQDLHLDGTGVVVLDLLALGDLVAVVEREIFV